MTQHTLSPLPQDAWPEVLSDLEDVFAGRLNVYRTMAHHPELLRAWTDLRQHVVLDTSLGRARSEVVILRAATHLKSAYEWTHHVSRARKIGLSDARIASLRLSPQQMQPDDAIIAQAVDDLIAQARLTPATHAALHGLVGHQGTLDLFATVGFYSTLAFIVNTFETPLDDAVAAELSDDPLARTQKDRRP